MDIRPPVWRTLLFIPVNNQQFVAKAHTRCADGVILDLEDSIAVDQKVEARACLASAVQSVAEKGTDVLVRINAESVEQDVAAATLPNVSALVIPKVQTAEAVMAVAEMLDHLERVKGLSAGAIGILPQIEDVRALPNLDAIAAASPRLLGMSLGSEDFSASAGMLPLPETLYGPSQQVVFACRRAGILPFGFPASIALIEDTLALEQAAVDAANMGFFGAFCIHPKQVTILNKALTPNEEDVSEARLLLAAFAKAEVEGHGVFVHQGKMVDLPVVRRARELVARAEVIASKLGA